MSRIDISDLRNKVQNEGATDDGKLSAPEWNRLVEAVIQNQSSVKAVKLGGLDPKYPDSEGIVEIPVISDSWTNVLRVQRIITENGETSYDTITNESSYLYANTNVPIRLLFMEYKQEEVDGQMEYVASNKNVIIKIIRPGTVETELASFSYIAKGYGSTEYTELNLQPYLSGGSNSLIIEVSETSTGENRRLVFTIVAANLGLSVASDNQWDTETLVLGDGVSLTPEYYVLGAVQKTLHIKFIKGENNWSDTVAVSTSSSTIPVSYLFTEALDQIDFFTEGIGQVEAWITATDGTTTIESNHVISNIIMVESGSTNTYVAIQNCIESMLNYESETMFNYNIFSPDVPATVTFILGNSDMSQTYLEVSIENRYNDISYDFTNILSIQSSYELVDVYIFAKIDGVLVNDGDPLGTFVVDNSEDFGAVPNEDFYLNPSLRTNQEANPDTIINAADNTVISGSTFQNISWRAGVDGWMEVDGRKVLRILAGGLVTIPYDIYSEFTNNSNHGLTVEIDFAVRNITNEEDPIVTIGNRNASSPRGIYMKALNGAFMSKSNSEWSASDVSWQEGVRTHLVFNYQHNYVLNNPEEGRGIAESATIAISRIYINGVINREYRVTNTSDPTEINAGGDIVIGQIGADIDIYGIRVYKRSITPEQVVKNYISTLPTVARKKEVFDANDILDDGVVSFAKAMAQGYNCIVWHGPHISRRYSNNPKRYGYAEIYQYNNGQLDRSHSGTLYGVECSGQGTTAMTYADWNVSFKEDKKTGEGHDEYKYQVGDALKNVFVDVDNNVGFGGTKFGYKLDTGDPSAKKLVGKINYASSMQSHKMGACNLYNDLYRTCVSSSITNFSQGQRVTVKEKPFLYFVQEVEGSDDSLKKFKGLMTFGPGKADKPTWGVSDSTLADGDSLVEGALNNNPLTDMRVPFVDTIDQTTGRYVCEYQLKNDLGTSMEAFMYAGAKNINWGFGDTLELHDTNDVVWDGVREADKTSADAPTTKQVKLWQPIFNFLYLMNTRIAPWSGSLAELNAAARVSGFDTSVAYWMANTVEGSYNKYDLYRCHYTANSVEYVPAGIKLIQGNQTYTNFNTLYDLSTATILSGVEEYTSNDLWYDVSDPTTDTRNITLNLQTELQRMISRHNLTSINFSGSAESVNLAMKKAICSIFRLYVGNNVYLNKDSVLFHHETMILWAGTDNRSKNTYYRLNPYASISISDDAHNISLSDKPWPNMEMNDDDLDTIFKTNNSGIQSKPYYVLESDIDEATNMYHWEGKSNVLNNTIQDAYGYGFLESNDINKELSNMMGKIFNSMVTLATGKTMPDGTAVDSTPVGCFDYYFFYIQKYFPAVAYNETARIRYEVPAILFRSQASNDGGESYPQDPIGQSLGDQYDSEKDYVVKRLNMLMGYAGHRSGQFGFRGYSGSYSATIKPHQYLYPMYEVGDQSSSTPTRALTRVAPQSSYTMSFTNSYSTNGVYFYFVDNLRELGNIAQWGDGTWSAEAENTPLSIIGPRLVKFEMWSDTPNGVVFNPRAHSFNLGSCRNIEEIDVHNASNLTNLIGLENLVRLNYLNCVGSGITSLNLPSTPMLEEVYLPSTYESLTITNCPNLSVLSLADYSNLTSVKLQNLGTFNSMGFINACRTNNAPLTTLELRNINWTDMTVALLNYILNIPNVTITGTMTMLNNSVNAINFNLKKKLIDKFGNIDSSSNPLRIIYEAVDFQSLDNLSIVGPSYIGNVDGLLRLELSATRPEINNLSSYVFAVDASNTSDYWKGSYLTTSLEDYLANTYDAVNNPTGYSIYLNPNTGEIRCARIDEDDFSGSYADTEPDFHQIKIDVTTIVSGNQTGPTASKTIYPVDRQARPGDFVYADGTYDPEYNDTKTCVGICFWSEKVINPLTNEVYWDRRCVTTRNQTSNAWGLYPETSGGTNGFNSIDLSFDGISSVYDVPDVSNLTSSGMSSAYILGNKSTWTPANGNDYYFDTQNPYLETYYGFKYPGGILGESLTTGYSGRSNSSAASRFLLVADNLIDAGNGAWYISPTAQTYMPIGKADTIRTVLFRNQILAAMRTKTVIPEAWSGGTEDSINDGTDNTYDLTNVFATPAASSAETEYSNVTTCITRIQSWARDTLGDPNYTKYRQWFFPAASYCYAYQPTAEKPGDTGLSDKFKAHQWYLPSTGELARLYFYNFCTHKYVTNGTSSGSFTLNSETKTVNYKKYAYFRKAMAAGLFDWNTATSSGTGYTLHDAFTASGYWSSTEYSTAIAWGLNFSSGYLNYVGYKCVSAYLRAVAAF